MKMEYMLTILVLKPRDFTEKVRMDTFEFGESPLQSSCLSVLLFQAAPLLRNLGPSHAFKSATQVHVRVQEHSLAGVGGFRHFGRGVLEAAMACSTLGELRSK